MTSEPSPPEAPSAPAPRPGARVWLIVAIVVALVAGGGIAAGLAFSGGGTSPATGTETAAQLDSIRSACQQWLRANPAQSGTAQWCRQMANWMSSDIDRNGMGPQMMWGNQADLEHACEQWMAASPPTGAASTDAHDWCDSMVSWMSADMGNWSGRGSWGAWMRDGPMFGGASGNGVPGPGSMGHP